MRWVIYTTIAALWVAGSIESSPYADSLDLEINLIDNSMQERIEEIYVMTLWLKTSQESAMAKENEKLSDDLRQLRQQLKEMQVQCKQQNLNEHALILEQLSSLAGRKDTCECVSKELDLVKNELMNSNEETRSLFRQSSEFFNEQFDDVKSQLANVTRIVQVIEENALETEITNRLEPEHATEAPTTTQLTMEAPVTQIYYPCKNIKRAKSSHEPKVVKGAYGTFYYTNEKMVWGRAISYCKSMGMKLAKLESVEKIKNISSSIESTETSLWLCGNNKAAASSEFRWTDDNSAVDDALWAANEPRMFPDLQRSCVVVKRGGMLACWQTATAHSSLCHSASCQSRPLSAFLNNCICDLRLLQPPEK